MKQRVFALHHIHRHMREAHIVLHKEGHRDHGLDHLMHQQKLLCVLQVSFSQIHVGARVDGAALWMTERTGLTDGVPKSLALWEGKLC